MIGTSLSETMEVASHWSSETHFIIEYRAPTAIIRVIFMSSVRFRYCKPKILQLAQLVERKIFGALIHTEVTQRQSAVIARTVRLRFGPAAVWVRAPPSVIISFPFIYKARQLGFLQQTTLPV